MAGKVIGILTSSMNEYFVRRLARGVKPYELQGKSDVEWHSFIEKVALERDLAGLIYGHVRLNVNQVGRFKSAGLPVVAVTERMEGIDWITVDEVKGAYLATRHLLGMGHRKIALISGPLLAIQSRLREDGFLRALREDSMVFGRERGISILNFAEDEGREAMNMLLDQPEPPTAVFVAAGDVSALGVLKALRDRGVSVPDQMSVVGFDNLEFSGQIYPKLSTVNQPLEAMGRWAAERLKLALAGERPSKSVGEILEPELVTRESVSIPRAARVRV
jgi:LacI family transcriptional regulator